MEAVGRLASEVAVTCDTLLRDASHDGQQWLATMDSDTLRHRGELLLGEVTRAASFLRQLADYGKEQTNANQPVDVSKLLCDFELVLKRVAGGDIQFVLPKTSPPLTVDVDVERIERILVNVASYGRQRMPFGGQLEFELATVVIDRQFVATHPHVRPGAHVLITVTEVRATARPVPADALRYQPVGTDGSTPESGKPGVDLGVLMELIADCGGHLWMTADPPGNMVLKIHLPKCPSDIQIEQQRPTRVGRALSVGRLFGR